MFKIQNGGIHQKSTVPKQTLVVTDFCARKFTGPGSRESNENKGTRNTSIPISQISSIEYRKPNSTQIIQLDEQTKGHLINLLSSNTQYQNGNKNPTFVNNSNGDSKKDRRKSMGNLSSHNLEESFKNQDEMENEIPLKQPNKQNQETKGNSKVKDDFELIPNRKKYDTSFEDEFYEAQSLKNFNETKIQVTKKPSLQDKNGAHGFQPESINKTKDQKSEFSISRNSKENGSFKKEEDNQFNLTTTNNSYKNKNRETSEKQSIRNHSPIKSEESKKEKRNSVIILNDALDGVNQEIETSNFSFEPTKKNKVSDVPSSTMNLSSLNTSKSHSEILNKDLIKTSGQSHGENNIKKIVVIKSDGGENTNPSNANKNLETISISNLIHTHYYDGKIRQGLGKKVSEKLEAINKLHFSTKKEELETFVNQIKHMLDKKAKSNLETIISEFIAFGNVNGNSNYDKSNLLYAHDLLYGIAEVYAFVTYDIKTELIQLLNTQLNEMEGGMCSSGRCARLTQVYISHIEDML